MAKLARLAAAAAALVVAAAFALLNLLRITNCNQFGMVGNVVGFGVYLNDMKNLIHIA